MFCFYFLNVNIFICGNRCTLISMSPIFFYPLPHYTYLPLPPPPPPSPCSQILIVIAQVQHSEHGLSLALFWGIRLSVVSVAINPLLYGLLARQYLVAYFYVLRRMFSFCCPCCVEPPPKDIFGECTLSVHFECFVHTIVGIVSS